MPARRSVIKVLNWQEKFLGNRVTWGMSLFAKAKIATEVILFRLILDLKRSKLPANYIAASEWLATDAADFPPVLEISIAPLAPTWFRAAVQELLDGPEYRLTRVWLKKQAKKRSETNL